MNIHDGLCLQAEEEEARRAAEREKKRREKEAAKQRRKEQMGDDYVSEEEEEEVEEEEEGGKGEEGEEQEEEEKPKGPSPILSTLASSEAGGEFWVSMGGYDAGYLYQCSMEGAGSEPEPYEAKNSIPIPAYDGKDLSLHSMCLRSVALQPQRERERVTPYMLFLQLHRSLPADWC